MTKRPCSSEVGFEPQLKMHISEKEIFHGHVPNSIHAKTLKLLFDGARKPKSNNGTGYTDFQVIQNRALGSRSKLKQMFINNHCKLEAESANKVYSEDFHHCNLVTSTEKMKCCFCEKSTCNECTITCARCTLQYCKTCSLSIYSADLDYLCLGCCE